MKSSRLRRVAIAIVLGSVLGLIAAAAVVLAFRETFLPEITHESLAAARARWKEKGPQSYAIRVELTGINAGTMEVEVDRGSVTAVSYNDRPADPEVGEFWTVPGLFDVIEGDLDSCAKATKNGARDATTPIFSRGQFDPQTGAPTAYRRITPSGTDAEWRITRLTSK